MNISPRPGPQEWRPIIDGQRTSGLTIAAYCLKSGITQGSFYTWKRRLRQPAKRNRSPKPAFVEVTPPRVETAGTIEIRLPAGRCLLVRRGFDRGLLVELIRALESIA
jgi:transposase-like protein